MSATGEERGAADAPSIPAEWECHDAVWLAWPEGETLWEGHLAGAREEWLGLCRAIAIGEALEILVRDREAAQRVVAALGGVRARTHVLAYGDVWVRDTLPLFARGARASGGRPVAVRFEFNGWGEKYLYANDPELAGRLASRLALPVVDAGIVLEGGALEVDGSGTVMTTLDCALHPGRNPQLTAVDIERVLQRSIGAQCTIWLRGQLARDHTDGHVDTLARFAGAGRVLCMAASSTDDPNRETLRSIREQLSTARDAQAREIEIVEIPSPGRVDDDDGLPLPASYLNYYVSNAAVVVPVFGTPYDSAAVDLIDACFPDRRAIGAPARHILTGGGAFHCITQQQPASAAEAGGG